MLERSPHAPRRAWLASALALACLSPALAAAATPPLPAPAVRADPLPRLTIDEALRMETGPNARRVLQWLKVMEAVVAQGKSPGFSAAAWAPLGAQVDQRAFRRVGNFGEVMGWADYTPMLTQWARKSWWTSRIRRVREVGNLVYLEAEERSSTAGPVGETGYSALNSLSVYEFDAQGKLVGLWVYDQMPR